MIKCYRIYQDKNSRVKGKTTNINLDELSEGGVQIKVMYSSVNYKDALAGTGKGRILKKYPLNGGIDCAGIVSSSNTKEFKPQDQVLVNGCHLSEFVDGGYSEIINVDPVFVVKKPDNISLKECMTIGTAGFTAALCIHRMMENSQTPDKGKILVTGATGGVGSFATHLFSKLGFHVVALTSKKQSYEYLKKLGAKEVVSFSDLNLSGAKPLNKALFGGCVDNLGGEVLEKIIPHINLFGNIASVGLASGFKVSTTVMPFILRGVSILGISSNNCDMKVKKNIWEKLATLWKPDLLDEIFCKEVGLDDLDKVFEDMLNRKISGRVVVKIG